MILMIIRDLLCVCVQTIKAADIATVRKLAKPPHLIMRIMDCVMILFQKRLDTVTQDPERPCIKPSWGESLKVLDPLSTLGPIEISLEDDFLN